MPSKRRIAPAVVAIAAMFAAGAALGRPSPAASPPAPQLRALEQPGPPRIASGEVGAPGLPELKPEPTPTPTATPSPSQPPPAQTTPPPPAAEPPAPPQAPPAPPPDPPAEPSPPNIYGEG
ncbi:MAG TPA: hypothetical protein VNO82_18520 [Solirubrobacteraceae bacterium]|nr:hypothetical protein [Solirubrobacteraceae bacterium]